MITTRWRLRVVNNLDLDFSVAIADCNRESHAFAQPWFYTCLSINARKTNFRLANIDLRKVLLRQFGTLARHNVSEQPGSPVLLEQHFHRSIIQRVVIESPKHLLPGARRTIK